MADNEQETPAAEPEVKKDPNRHLKVIRLEDLGERPHPAARTKERTVFVDGRNYEHVSDDPDGVWVYRHM